MQARDATIIRWLGGETALGPDEVSRLDIAHWIDPLTGSNALHYAVSEENIEVIPFLLFSSVPICGTDDTGSTPLVESIYQCRRTRANAHPIARLLADAGGRNCPPDSTGRLAVHYAVECATGDCVRITATANNINFQDIEGLTPLHICAQMGSSESARALLELGAQCHSECDEKLLPIHWACSWNNVAVLQMLLSMGGDPESPDCQGRTPLYFAVLFGSVDSARELLKCGVSTADIVASDTKLSMYEAARWNPGFEKLLGLNM